MVAHAETINHEELCSNKDDNTVRCIEWALLYLMFVQRILLDHILLYLWIHI